MFEELLLLRFVVYRMCPVIVGTPTVNYIPPVALAAKQLQTNFRYGPLNLISVIQT
jgi:hypothetical protein